MKQVFARRAGAETLNVPAPVVEPGHVLVAVAYSLISAGTEVGSVQNSSESLLQRVMDKPERVLKVVEHLRMQGISRTVALLQGNLTTGAPIGYSCAGVVVQVGAGVNDLQAGDRVACAGAGKANHAEWVVVPRNLLTVVPEQVSLRDAASTTLGAIAMQGVRRADARLGEWVAVIGLGLLGQLTLQLLRASGVNAVGFDVDAQRAMTARTLGAPHAFVSTEIDPKQVIRELTGGHGVDVTIITAASSSDALAQQAMEITRLRGRVVVVGAVGLGLQRSPFYEKEIDFLIARSYGPGRYDPAYEEEGLDYPYAYVRWTENRNMAAYLQLLSAGQINFAGLVGAEYGIDQVHQAYEVLQSATERPIAVVLRYLDAPQPMTIQPRTTRVDLTSHRAGGRLGVAIVGAGGFAQGMHLPNLQRLADQYHLRAVVSRTGASARTAGERFAAEYVTSDYEQVLSDPGVDVVFITSRHHQHVEQALLAAEAGKAIFLEKPMALNQAELDRLVPVLEATNVPFMVGFNRRFAPAAQRALTLLSTRQGPLMLLYRVNAGYIPLNNWVHGAQGGGRIVGEACHMFDLFQFLVGGATATEVTTMAIVPKAEHISASDNRTTTVRYSDGSVATLIYTALGTPTLPKEYLEVFSGGSVLVLDDFKALHVYGTAQQGWAAEQQDKGHMEELRAFARYARGESGPPITLDSLIETTKVSFLAAGGGDELCVGL